VLPLMPSPSAVLPLLPQDVHSELFHSLSGSFGSLGMVVGASIECVPAPRFVRLAYTLHGRVEDATAEIRRLSGLALPGGEGAAGDDYLWTHYRLLRRRWVAW
jgi:hypothetical protein